MVETFAVNELVKQAGWAEATVEFGHFRTRDQHEVDLVVRSEDGAVAGVEVKAASTVTDEDFRGLRLLRDRLGPDFVGGVLLNLGRHSYTHGDRLHVLRWTGCGPEPAPPSNSQAKITFRAGDTFIAVTGSSKMS